MRRKDRELSEEKAWEILKSGNHGILSTCNDNLPYGVPLSYNVEDKNIYFHCAIAGHKSDNIDKNPNISFCVITKDKVSAKKLTVYFESVIVFGKVEKIEDQEEKTEALVNLTKKFSPGDEEKKKKVIIASLHKLDMYKITVEKITGKANYEKNNWWII